MKKLIPVVFFLAVFALPGILAWADVYFGDKAAVTSLHSTTNFLISVLGSSSNAPVRLINTSNLLTGYATSNDLVSATNSLASTNYVNSTTNSLATTNYVNTATNNLATTNFVNTTSSNRVTVAAGSNITITTNSASGVITYTVAANSTFISSAFDNIVLTNALNRIISRVASTVTTQQIDVVAGPSVYYWPLVNSNIVCQFTNMWTSQVSNRVIDFTFSGGAADKTVTFLCPNPAGVIFHWGLFIPTNGATSLTVTNGHTASATFSTLDTNFVESFYSPGI